MVFSRAWRETKVRQFSSQTIYFRSDAEYIEIITWVVRAYDFYSRVFERLSRTSERSERVSDKRSKTSE